VPSTLKEVDIGVKVRLVFWRVKKLLMVQQDIERGGNWNKNE
jgi:hypothetical protein